MSSLIEVKHLKKYYNKGEIKALDDVSVNIERGDVMVVIGPSGSGKSTLLRSLNLLEVPTAGEIVSWSAARRTLLVRSVSRTAPSASTMMPT